MSVRVSWPSLTGDWDVKLYEDTNGDGKSQDDEPVVSTSQTGPSNVEEVSANGTPRLHGGQEVRAAGEQLRRHRADNYEVDITFAAPPPFKPAQVESYTLTCEQGGRVFDTQQVQIDRGQVKQLDLSACARAIAAAGGAAPTPASGQSTPACASAAILRSRQGDRRRAAACAFAFSKRVRQRVNVDVFQVAVGRQVIGERLVARFRDKSALVHLERALQAQARAARLLLRPLLDPAAQRPVATCAARCCACKGGRFTARPDFYRRDTCGLLRSYKLERAAFGGSTQAAAARRLPPHPRGDRAHPGAARATGRQDARAAPSASRPGARTARACAPRGLRKGDYQVRITVSRAGSRTATSTLTSRKL